MNTVAILEPPGSQIQVEPNNETIRMAEISVKSLKQAIKPLEKVSKGIRNQEPVIEISIFWCSLILTSCNEQHSFSAHIHLDKPCPKEYKFTLPTEALVTITQNLTNQDPVLIQKQGDQIHFINGIDLMAEVAKVPLPEMEEFNKNQHYASCKSKGWGTGLHTSILPPREKKSRFVQEIVRIVSGVNEITLIGTDGPRTVIATLKKIQERDRSFEVSLQKSIAKMLVLLLDDKTEVRLSVSEQSITFQFWSREMDVWFCSESILGRENFLCAGSSFIFSRRRSPTKKNPESLPTRH